MKPPFAKSPFTVFSHMVCLSRVQPPTLKEKDPRPMDSPYNSEEDELELGHRDFGGVLHSDGGCLFLGTYYAKVRSVVECAAASSKSLPDRVPPDHLFST